MQPAGRASRARQWRSGLRWREVRWVAWMGWMKRLDARAVVYRGTTPLALRIVLEQLLEPLRVVVQEVFRDREMLGVFEGDFADARTVELDDFRVRVGQQDG